MEPNSSSALWIAMFFLIVYKFVTKPKLDDIPTIGFRGPILSYIGAIKFISNAREMVQEGYDKYNGGVFKVPLIDQWLVVATGPKLIQEIRNAPEDVLSLMEANIDMLQAKYTTGLDVCVDTYHIDVIKSQLTHNLSLIFDDMLDEVMSGFHDVIPLQGQEWTNVPAVDAIVKIVSRTANRVFVGLPLGRNPDFNAFNAQCALDIMAGATVINLFPDFLKPIAGKVFGKSNRIVKDGLKHLQPILEERERKIAEYGRDYPDKPADMLSWLMDAAPGHRRSHKDLVLRILAVNIAAIHTSSMTFVNALFHLAENPELAKPLREEVDAIVLAKGWTKSSLRHMKKIDSFLRESQRLNGLTFTTMNRKVMVPYMMPNGIQLPVGTRISIASTAVHTDEANYPNAQVFDPFRFVFEQDTKQQVVSVAPHYLSFGFGKHACPGRFFAGQVLKIMLAYVVITYDVKFENGEMRPPNHNISWGSVPNQKARVAFRARQK